MRLKIKHYYQTKSYSCGPVSLKMVFKYLGKNFSRKRLIRLSKANEKTGTTHKNLLKTARKLGFKTKSRSNAKISDIMNYIEKSIPVIVNYYEIKEKIGHYSVISGYDKKNKILYLDDPTHGRAYTFSFNRFLKTWHNHNKTSNRWLMVVHKE